MVASFKTNLLDWLKTKVYVKNEIDTKLQNKSDTNHTHTTATVSANGLMSKEDKSKLDGIATEANKTVVDSSLSSSSTNPVQNKVVNSALSGKANSSHSHSISNITNLQSTLDSKSETGHNHDDRYYTETEIDAKVNNINFQINSLIGFTATIVNSLPSTGEVGVMYLKLNTSSSVEGNVYDEYIWVNNKFEKIGSTETTVDLSGYVTQTEMNTQLANKANINHSHLSNDIEINPDIEDGMWVSEYGINRQTDVNCYVYDHEKKLENIGDGANKTVVDSSLSSSSTNPVQNKVVNSALNGKSNTGHEHSSDEIHYAYDQNVSVTTILENKAAKNHTHNYIPSTVSQTVFGSGDSKVTATRQGNVVTLRLYLAGEFTESWKQWCTITDSQYLPDTDGEFTDFGISSSHGTHMLLRINSDGRVRTGYGQNKTSYCYQTITFLKNN